MAESQVFEPRRRTLSAVLLIVVLLMIVPYPVGAQGVAPVTGLDFAPSSPMGLPGSMGGPQRGSDTINLSSRMFPDILPTIPGLEISYLHSFGKHNRGSSFHVEFVHPLRLGANTSIYGEIHGTVHDPFRSGSWWGDRIDLSAGGGYRRRFGDRAILGVHGFYDASRGWDEWRSSASVGGFMLTMLPGDDAIDLTFNWYSGANTGRFGVGSWGMGTFDGTMTYYHELWEGGPDLQLSLIGYGVDDLYRHVFSKDSGYGARIQVASRDGMLRGSYMYEADRQRGNIHTVGVNINVVFSLENLLVGRSPIEKPTPIFSGPRNIDHTLNATKGTDRHLKKSPNWPCCAWEPALQRWRNRCGNTICSGRP